MSVLDLDPLRILIGEFCFQRRDNQLVIALAGQMDAAILKRLDCKHRGFLDRFAKRFIRLDLAVIGRCRDFDHLSRLHDVARVDVLIDQHFANIVRPFEIVDQPAPFSFRRIGRQPPIASLAGRGRYKARRYMTVFAAFAVEVMFEAPRPGFGARNEIMTHTGTAIDFGSRMP